MGGLAWGHPWDTWNWEEGSEFVLGFSLSPTVGCEEET